MTQLRYSAPESVLRAPSEEGTVLLNVDSGEYHYLNGTAEQVYALLSGGGTLAEAARVLETEYDVPLSQAHSDCESLVSDLLGRGLLVPS